MQPIHRVLVIVLDGCGVGALPDAAAYGDAGANTLAHILLHENEPPLPHMQSLGLLELLPDLKKYSKKKVFGCYGKMAEQSQGKDSANGHWEIMGVVIRKPFPTYPAGFPRKLIAAFERKIGRKILGNKIASGTEILKELGAKHLATGFPIVYTSADSVFQIAAHESMIPVSELYRMCSAARRLLRGRHAMGRVIARPFVGRPGNFHRTPARKDFTLPPPSKTVLDRIYEAPGRTVGIGKIGDLFSERGLSRVIHTTSNADGIEKTLKAMRQESKAKLIFTNLVDTDMVYGHRNDCRGYYRCLRRFDNALPHIINAMRSTDVLILTSDHGCDPIINGTDHTREYVPVLMTGKALAEGVEIGTRKSFADLGQTILELLGLPPAREGKSFAAAVLRR